MLLLRQVLEGIYRQLSEGSHSSFSGLFARMQYVHVQLNPPSELVAQLNQLRILANQVAHEGLKPSDEYYLAAALAIRNLLSWLSPSAVDSGLDEELRSQGASPFPPLTQARKLSFLCVVLDWMIRYHNGQAAGLEIHTCDEQGETSALILNNLDKEGNSWSTLAKVLWRFCTINCLNLTEIAGQDRCYTNNPLTRIVVEPDFLLEASAVAECCTNKGLRPENFILGRLLREPSREATTQGNMVNQILDELISRQVEDYPTLFRKAMARMPISLVSLGKQAAQSIFDTIRDVHFNTLKSFSDTLKDSPVQLEPTYISPKYGLQGRLDILFSQDGKTHIVELKSGKAPGYGVWKEHEIQVVAYNMLIRDAIGSRNLGHSSILYSAAGQNCLRNVVNTLEQELALLMCRNRIVGLLHTLADDPRPFFDWLLRDPAPLQRCAFPDKLNLIIRTLNGLAPREYEWFLGQLRLLLREIWLEKTGGLGRESIYGHNALWREAAKIKEDRYKLLGSLSVEEVDFNLVRFRLPEEKKVTDFRAGDIVVLYRQEIEVQLQELLRGQISLIDEEQVEVLIRGGLRQIPPGFRESRWVLEHDILESSLYSPLQSVFSFLQAPEEVRQLWLGLREPKGMGQAESDGADIGSVIRRMLSARGYHIVQGPPGTGKTSGLLTSYILTQWKETQHNILILSFTNRAVDEICLNLRKQGIPFLRTGQSAEITDELLESRIQGRKFDEIDALVRSGRIWVATVQSCSSWLPDLSKILHFDELVIDEASQIMENSILGMVTAADKVILIGDQNQLPPITRQTDAGFGYVDSELQNLCFDNYGQSLMERIVRVCRVKGWSSANTMLQKHYRMHEEIAGLVQPYYQDRLVAALSRQQEALPVSSDPLLCCRLVWIDFPPSRYVHYDPLQVRCVLWILERFLREGIVRDFACEIGIVAPFRAMIHALLKEMNPRQKQITVDTVERFQGSERSNIIITLPLHNAAALAKIEALSPDRSVDRKLNVAVSRAQERLIVLGSSQLCYASPHYKLLMDKIAASGNVFAYQDVVQENQ